MSTPLFAPRQVRRSLALAAAVGSLFAGRGAFAQATLPPGAVGDLSPEARESLQNVTVNDSPEARKDIDTARGMERQKEWAKAAGWYQEVLEKYRRRVVAWKEDDRHVINRYRGIVFQVREALARWPAEGITAYRARYEATAAQLLASAGPDDFNSLNGLVEAYFVTDAGKQAALRLIDLHMEAGEFDAAARVGELLLDWYPQDQLIAERPRVLFRTSLAHHLCGDDKPARARADELRQKFATATGRIFGKDASLPDALDALLKQEPKLTRATSPDSWPMFGGSPDRAHVSSAQGRMGAKVFGIELPKRVFKGANAVQERNAADREEADGRTLGIMPAVDGGAIYFQDGAHVWAASIDSGLPLPGWAQTYAGGTERRGVYALKNAQPTRTTQTTVTLSDTALFAVMGQTNRLAMFYAAQGMDIGAAGGADTGTRLVSLDKATGKERWRVSMTALDPSVKEEERERLKALDFSGSPVVVGDNVFAIARGGKDVQFENCYVVCFDAGTGQYRWSSLIASANTPFVAYGGDQVPPTNTLSHLAYASGRLYALTNLGALASVDAYNGSVVWLSIYPRDLSGNANDAGQFNQVMRFGGPRWTGSAIRTWEFNPVLAQDGKLFVLPTDGKLLLVYDAASGEELKRVNLEDLDHPNTLLGVVNDRVILCGRSQVFSVLWAKYDNAKTRQELVDSDVVLEANLFKGAKQQGGDLTRGRGFVTAERVYVPTAQGLLPFSLPQQLKAEHPYPKDRDWDQDEGPGNVVVTGEHVILAGARSIDVYTDMALARAKLDREVAAAPAAVDPRLHYAEVMFAAGQTPVTLEKVREAIALLGGADAMQSGPSRQRVFNDALTFAQKLKKSKQGEANEAAIAFFALAAKAAESPTEQVNYRLSRATFLRDNVQPDSFATAITLYQEILQDAEWRAVGVMPDDEDGAAGPAGTGPGAIMQAGLKAEREIAEVQAKHPEAYAAVERRAVAAMDAAKAGGKPDEMLDVAQQYPNAAVAPHAMLAAAEAFERDGNARQATHVLRQIYRRYGNTADKGLILESMARNYLALPGGLDVALARLQRSPNFLDTRLTRALPLPDGSSIDAGTPFKQAIERLRRARAAAPVQPLADLHVPSFRAPTEAERDAGRHGEQNPFKGSADDAAGSAAFAIDDVSALVLPPADWNDSPRVNAGPRPDRVAAVLADNQLALFSAGSSKPLGTCDKFTDAARAAVWTRATGTAASRLIAWSSNEIVAMDEGGTTAWAVPLKSVAAGDLLATGGGLQGIDVANDSVADTGTGDEQIVMARGGRLIFRGGRPRNAIRMMQQIQQQQAAVAGQNQADNAAAGAAPNAPPAAPQELITLVNPLGDRVIAATTAGRVLCLNSADGKVIWQTRVSPRPIQRLIANEDFTALRVTEDNTVRIVVLDNFAGQTLMVRNFAMETSIIPVNMALSPDGMLVWTLPDRICGKDLYEPGAGLKFEFPPNRVDPNNNNNNGAGGGINPLYVGCNKPGQLVIAGQRVLTVEQNGRFVTVHSLEDGTILKHDDRGDQRPTMLSSCAPNNSNLRPNSGEVNITVTVSGPYMYVMGPMSLVAYNLDKPAAAQWTGSLDTEPLPNFRTLMPTRDYVVVAAEPGVRRADVVAGNAVPVYRLSFFQRSPVPGEPDRENGLYEYMYDVGDPTGIAQWQTAEGGVYYLTGEHKLRFLAGRRGS